MKILLTGARGFIGRHFAAHALAQGAEVVPLAADLTDKAAVAAEVAATRPERGLHLGALSFVAHADEARLYAVNTVGATNLLSALAALPEKPTKVVLVSSANVYGNSPNSPLSEREPPAPVNHYAMSKLAMEYLARTFSGTLPIVIARPFNFTGPGQAASFIIPKLVTCFATRAPEVELGNIDVEREFNDVRLAAAALWLLLAHGQADEVYNLCTGLTYPVRAVIERLGALTGHRVAIRSNPTLIRANEITRLCGSPEKLHQLAASAGAALPVHTLEETLRWMLEQAAQAAGKPAAQAAP
ncbi:MAG: GDP-mannose 4,6-dehydratase [Casimicrobiaceae bacterium]